MLASGYDAVRIILETLDGCRYPVVAFVGAGGKTSIMFAVAEAAWERARGCAATGPVIITTTTHIADPRTEVGRFATGRPVWRVLVDARLAVAPVGAISDGNGLPGPDDLFQAMRPAAASSPLVLASGVREQPDPSAPHAGRNVPAKLGGIHPAHIGPLAEMATLVLVEADGAAMRPVKAPAGHEPVVPAMTGLVVGVIGLSCLGKRMDSVTVHRPQQFAVATGCAPGAAITAEHLAALATHPEGLFKGCPPEARKMVVLNQADVPDRVAIDRVMKTFAKVAWLDPVDGGPGTGVVTSMKDLSWKP